ncbi:helix-turn-helix domain-containing protein [Olivibacter sp. SDN3]|uniref:helix-turn-helix domain-containing protein n=1 Tax=Olivibacter sp. SDN3 TaxID=2764720 RepID=UPI001650D8AF|nr:helix-turn-helix domain-containing protein [Olivibacter sp. SDN3]QNL48941.1 helix-turn-helix domain-containing protein [Olivibacter sp. SDN3]
MAVEIITREDLMSFKHELLNDLRDLLSATKVSQQKKWLKTREVIKMLQISPGTLQNYRVNGTIRYTKFGNTIYYSLQEIEQLLEQGRNSQ